ncbi:MAG: PASTA domain-containing protein [Bacteroidales bacterium]|nr:PASTA domain-containing protein [Bacteroidales bacterium]MCF6341294.1 PASTA domain-containing protein [Bacteroidales bacterium]
MGFFYFLGRKKFYIHLLIAIVFSFVLLWLVLMSLDLFTRHGDVYIIPDFKGKTVEQLLDDNYDEFFDLQVIDSIYDKRNEKGSIIIQNPLPGAKVKQGRNVYLTIVAETPEKVLMPNLKNLSLRQALVTLEANDLPVGRLEYVEYFARNAVVDQLVKNEPIESGTEISKGTAIDLMVGKGKTEAKVRLPLLIAMTPAEAKKALNLASLNMGREYYLDDKDPDHARVFKTKPEALTKEMLRLGQKVNVWYRSDEQFDFAAYLNQFKQDTVAIDTAMKQFRIEDDEGF